MLAPGRVYHVEPNNVDIAPPAGFAASCEEPHVGHLTEDGINRLEPKWLRTGLCFWIGSWSICSRMIILLMTLPCGRNWSNQVKYADSKQSIVVNHEEIVIFIYHHHHHHLQGGY